MKKFMALMLAMLMMLSGAAVAETVEPAAVTLAECAATFDMTAVLPEGMTVVADPIVSDDFSVVSIESADADGLGFVVSVAATEEYPDKSMADLTAEEKAAILENLIADTEAAEYGMMTLADGREVFYYIERGEYEAGNVVDIYDGYIIQLTYVRGNCETLLDSDVEAADAFMDSIVYTPVSAN